MAEMPARCWSMLDVCIAGAALVLVIVLTLLGVVMRYCFNAPLAWLEEMQMLLVVWMTFFGGSAAFRYKAHVGIELVVDLFAPPVRRSVAVIALCIVAGVLAFLAWQGGALVYKFSQTGRATSILGIPYMLIYAAIPVGSLLMLGNALHAGWHELALDPHGDAKRQAPGGGA